MNWEGAHRDAIWTLKMLALREAASLHEFDGRLFVCFASKVGVGFILLRVGARHGNWAHGDYPPCPLEWALCVGGKSSQGPLGVFPG